MEQNPNIYKITYSNSLIFEGVKLAFRKQKLFNINSIPIYIPFNENDKFWLINRKQLTVSKAEELVIKEEIIIDVSDLQWNIQIQLDQVFNL